MKLASRLGSSWVTGALLFGAALLSGCGSTPAARLPDLPESLRRKERDLVRHGAGHGPIDPLPRVEAMRPGCWVPAVRLDHAPEIDGAVVSTNDEGVWVAALLSIGF